MNSHFDKYRHHLSKMQLSREQEDELLLAVWSVVEHFVDVGLGWGAVQAVLEGSEQDSKKDARIEVGSSSSSNKKQKKRDRGPS